MPKNLTNKSMDEFLTMFKDAEDHLRDIRVELLRRINLKLIPTCQYCHTKKGTSWCKGYDECIYSPSGENTLVCDGWGNYCCRCGADYARGQIS